MNVRLLHFIALLSFAWTAIAEIREQAVAYRHGDTELRGYLYYDDRQTAPRPGILVVHEWWGLNAYARKRARMLAELGYTAFALDMYGAGQVTRHAETAAGWMKQITSHQPLWLERAKAGLAVLRDHPRTNAGKLAAIGYCFGGSTVLKMAYANLPLKMVASFHGSLPLPAEGEKPTSTLFIAHGAQDAFVPQQQLADFMRALDQSGSDYILSIHGNARHGFTNPDAQAYGLDNLKYDPQADHRSWALLKIMLEEKLGL